MAGDTGAPCSIVTSRGKSHDVECAQPSTHRFEPEAPRRLGLFRALRRIENRRRELPRIGHATVPADDPVRLGQDPTLAFEGASIVSWDESRAAVRIAVSPFGMFGPNGPLPLHLTEHAYQRNQHHRDESFARFADIFHHRLLTYFYRAWADAQPTVSYDRPDADSFADHLSRLIGERPAASDATARDVGHLLLRAAGHLSSTTRHPEGLAKLVTAVFGVPARVDEFVGAWLPIPEEYCWRIDAAPIPGEQPMGVLGLTTRVGTEVWDRLGKFRVVLGPLSPEVHESFQLGQPALAQLVAIVQRYAGTELIWELRLLASKLTPTILGLAGTLGRTAHVGDEASAEWQDLQFDPLADAGALP